MNHQYDLPQLPNVKAMAQRVADGLASIAGGRYGTNRTSTEVLGQAMKLLQDLVNSVHEGPEFNLYRIGDEASLSKLNADLLTVRQAIANSTAGMIKIEQHQLVEFNLAEERANQLMSRLQEVKKRLNGVKAQTKESRSTVVLGESFPNLSFIDTDKTTEDELPSVEDGYLTLGQEPSDRQVLEKAEVKIDRINHPKLTYPSDVERPVGIVTEGRYYGWPEDVRPEGGAWNIAIRQPITGRSDELGIAHDASTYLNKRGDLEEILPRVVLEEASRMSARNIGWSDQLIAAGRKLAVDGKAETIWECEYVLALETPADIDPSDVSSLSEAATHVDLGKLEVALLVDLKAPVTTNTVRLSPFVWAGSRMTAALEVAEDSPSGLLPVENAGPFSWKFTTRRIRYMRITLSDTSVQPTPYPTLAIEFNRGIQVESEDAQYTKKVLFGYLQTMKAMADEIDYYAASGLEKSSRQSELKISSVLTGITVNDTGWVQGAETLRVHYDRARIAVGIRDIELSDRIYREKSEFITKPYRLVQPARTIQLETDEWIPSGFTQAIKYYISFDGQTWTEISPIGGSSKAPDMLTVNSNGEGRISAEDPTSFRLKVSMARPSGGSFEKATPVLRGYRLKVGV